MAKRKELTEADLMRWVAQSRSLVRARGQNPDTHRGATGKLLLSMKPSRIAELFKELDIDYLGIVRELHRLSQEGKSSDGVRLAALRELRNIYAMVAATHPDLEADLKAGGEGPGQTDGDETPAARWFREHKSSQVGTGT